MRQVFLSYAHSDLESARRLYRALGGAEAVRVWFDKEDLLPGMRWQPAIFQAIRNSRYFIALMSKESVSGEGFRDTELGHALDIAKQFSPNDIFIIPTRLEDCVVPFEELKELQYADLFPDWTHGIERLRKSMRIGAAKQTAESVERGGQPDRRLSRYRIQLIDLGGHYRLAPIARALTSVQELFEFEVRQLAPSRKALVRMGDSPHLDVDALSKIFFNKVASLQTDLVICLTPRLLTFEEEGTSYYNFLAIESPDYERVTFASTNDLEEFAAEAGISYETGLAYVIASQITGFFAVPQGRATPANVAPLELWHHAAIRGCPMDYTEDHADMVPGLRKGRYCAACAKHLKKSPAFRDALEAMLRWGRAEK